MGTKTQRAFLPNKPVLPTAPALLDVDPLDPLDPLRRRVGQSLERFSLELGTRPPTSSVTASPGAKRRGETTLVVTPRRSGRGRDDRRHGLTTWAVSPLRFAPGEAVTEDVGGPDPSGNRSRSRRK